MTEDMRNACYTCEHRRNTAGSAHSRCVHPLTKSLPKDPLTEVFAILASVGRVEAPTAAQAQDQLNVTGAPNGIKKGWFNWPFNFDPTWLKTCDGYTSNKVDKDE